MNSQARPPDTEAVKNRRRNLATVVELLFEGKAVLLVEHVHRVHDVDINQGELSGLQRTKSFGEKKARRLEQLLDLPPNALDLGAEEFRSALKGWRGDAASVTQPLPRQRQAKDAQEKPPWPFSTPFEDFLLLPQEVIHYLDITIASLVREHRTKSPSKTRKSR